MSEYVFRDAPGYGCADDVMMEDGITSAREYYSQENSDHYGTLHERIVRCRDCAWFENPPDYGAYCTSFGSPLDDYDGFCAWGVKRKEGGE